LMAALLPVAACGFNNFCGFGILYC